MIDWNNLKIEFLNSNLSKTKFLESKGIKPNDGNVNRITRDWVKDKAEYKLKISKETENKMIEQQSVNTANMNIKINEMAQYLINLLPTLEINNTRDYKSASSALKDIRDIVVNDDKDGGIDDATFNNTLAKLLTRRDE